MSLVPAGPGDFCPACCASCLRLVSLYWLVDPLCPEEEKNVFATPASDSLHRSMSGPAVFSHRPGLTVHGVSVVTELMITGLERTLIVMV